MNMHIGSKPPIHLWIYNNPFFGISDQVDYFTAIFQQHGYPVTVGRQPSKSSLNVVIENFSTVGREIFINFCKSTNKRVAVIMTEHLDLVAGKLMIHGDPLWSENDYMHPATQVARIKHLFECIPFIRSIFVLGDLPKLGNIHAMLPGLDVRWIPFPAVNEACLTKEAKLPERSLLFTGGFTEYREGVMATLKSSGFEVLYPEKAVSRNRRDALNKTSRIILNIPQRNDWKWLSLMRIIAALRCGRATVSLATQDDSEISGCTYQISLNSSVWQERLNEYICQWQAVYYQAYENYNNLSEQFSQKHPFPHDLLELWALTDRLSTLKK